MWFVADADAAGNTPNDAGHARRTRRVQSSETMPPPWRSSLPALARLAQRHDLDLIAHLLGMTLMEAEEYLRLRSKRKLS